MHTRVGRWNAIQCRNLFHLNNVKIFYLNPSNERELSKLPLFQNNNIRRVSNFKERLSSVLQAAHISSPPPPPISKSLEPSAEKKQRSKEKKGVIRFRDLHQFILAKKTIDDSNSRQTMIANGYVPIKFLGSGKFGKVLACKCLHDNSFKAIKILNVERDKKEFRWTWITPEERKQEHINNKNVKQFVDSLPSGFVKEYYLNCVDELSQKLNDLDNPLYKKLGPARSIAEKEILKILGNHPFFTTLIGSFGDTKFAFLVFNIFEAGTIQTILNKRRKMSEKDASFYASELLLAIEFLSKNEIYHRDIKPANVLLDGKKKKDRKKQSNIYN